MISSYLVFFGDPHGQDGTVEEKKKVLEQPPSVKVPLVLGATPFKLSWFGINGF